MHVPSLIQWYEGMFLSPHHFQQLQKRYDSLLSAHLALFHPHAWGVHTLTLDPLALGEGFFQVSELQAIMPDGTYIHYPDEGGHKDIRIDLKPHISAATRQPIKIYACVPKIAHDRSPVIGEWARYDSVEGKHIHDDNMRDSAINIPYLHPKLTLIVAEGAPKQYTSFPLAEVSYYNEGFHLTSFTAPCLNITQHSPFYQRAVSIIERMRNKANYLASKWEQQVGSVMAQDTALQLRPLLKCIPLLESRLRHQSLPPFQLFTLLAEVYGELTSLHLTRVPPSLPAYQHDQFFYALHTVYVHIEHLLDSIEQSVTILPFNQKDRLFFLKMDPVFFTKDLYLSIKGPPSMSVDELSTWIYDAVIASDSFVEEARSKRIIGALRQELLREDMQNFLIQKGTIMVRLSPPFDFVREGETLNIFNASDHKDARPVSIALYLKNPKPVHAHAA